MFILSFICVCLVIWVLILRRDQRLALDYEKTTMGLLRDETQLKRAESFRLWKRDQDVIRSFEDPMDFRATVKWEGSLWHVALGSMVPVWYAVHESRLFESQSEHVHGLFETVYASNRHDVTYEEWKALKLSPQSLK
jgi:hypothetical protein